MSRYLFTVWPYTGHLNSCMSVAAALHARGHEIGFFTGRPAQSMIEDAGMSFFGFNHLARRLRELVDDTVPPGEVAAPEEEYAFYNTLIARYSQSYQGITRIARSWTNMNREWLLGTVPQQIADLEPVLESWKPDVVVTDPLMWSTFLILHETQKLPVAVLSLLSVGCLVPGPDAPPNGLGLPRPHNWYTRLLSLAVTRVMDRMTFPIRREASQMRQRYGLPPLQGGILAQSGRVPLHLVCSIPELDYMRRDLPPSVHYVGACTWDRPSRQATPEWLAGLSTQRTVVFVTEGTAQVAGKAIHRAVVLRAALQGLANLPIDVILSTGGRDPEQLDLGPVPPNMRVVQYVPYSELYPRLSIVVTNGGTHGIRGALAAGLPLVIIPLEWDQFEGAQRVAEVGAGIRIPMRHCTPERLRAAIQRILSEPSFQDNARKMAAAFAHYGNTATAVHLLESAVGDARST